jgi:cell division protein FtsL
MNDLLDRIDVDPLASLRPQSARENERALAFALELTEGSPALDAVRGRGILASMIAEQRVELEMRARSLQQSQTGFSRPSNRVTPVGRASRVSAEGPFALPATLRPATNHSGSGSRISANAQYADQANQRVSTGEARARAMSPAPAAMLGNSVRGPQGQRLRTVDAPSYGRNASQTANQTGNRTANRTATRTVATGQRQSGNYASNGSLALADPEFAPRADLRAQAERNAEIKTARPSLRVLSGGKTLGNTRKKVFGVLAVVALVTIAFAAVFMHAGLARTQLGIDKLNVEITQAERMNQRLRVQVATLEAPDRIVSVAQELGLEPPKTVRFLPTAAPIALAATRIVR